MNKQESVLDTTKAVSMYSIETLANVQWQKPEELGALVQEKPPPFSKVQKPLKIQERHVSMACRIEFESVPLDSREVLSGTLTAGSARAEKLGSLKDH